METLNIKKRKKRKTRKCLDELRRKTHRANDVYRIYKNTDAKVCKNKSNYIKNNCITANRLTLINKAIISETVTREQLAALESKNLHLNKCRETAKSNLVNNSDTKSNNNGTVVRKEDIPITENRNREMNYSSPNTSDVVDVIMCDDVNTPKSVPLFSPGSQSKEINAKSTSPFQISLSSNSSTDATLNTVEPAPDIYDHIIDGIDLYLEQEHPHIIKAMDEEVEKVKADFVSSFVPEVTSNSDTTSDNTPSAHYSSPERPYSSPNVPIIENPRDYIAHSWSQRSAESKTSGIQVTSPSASSSSVSIHISSPSPLVSTVYDTPEYRYYPHRLN